MKIFETKVEPFTTNWDKDYKTPIKEIISSSSLSYLLNPIKSKRLLIKLVWIVFLIVFFFASIYYVVLNILDYLQYETTTSIFTINERESAPELAYKPRVIQHLAPNIGSPISRLYPSLIRRPHRIVFLS